MARLTIRVDLGPQAAIGPGKVRLLELIEARGSLRAAAAAMGMSYRRAWLLLREIEAAMGAPAVAGRTGGSKGGGSALTPLGRAVIGEYREIERQATRSASLNLRALSRLCRPSRGTSG